MSTQARPLDGLKVVELGTLIAGPFAARILAEFGAEVIKVESPDGGDPLRKWRLLYEGTSLWWFVQARNKKSVTLNLKHPDAIAGSNLLGFWADADRDRLAAFLAEVAASPPGRVVGPVEATVALLNLFEHGIEAVHQCADFVVAGFGGARVVILMIGYSPHDADQAQ